MDTRTAARRWADTWHRCWIARETEPIVALYAPSSVYTVSPFREPNLGPEGARSYLSRVFGEETDVLARFGDPIVDGSRAAIQWWATLIENGIEVTLAGTSVLRFDGDGLVVDEWDSWNEADGRISPPADFGAGNR